MAKKVTYRLIILAILLIGMNFIYKKWFYEADLQKHSDIINLVRAIPDDADIIYLGESSNITYKELEDVDKRPISAFIGDFFPTLHTYDITKPASHAGIYKVLLNQLPETNKKKTIVVTLNLRSFNAQWIYSDLETVLQKSVVLLQPYPVLYNRFMLSFKGYDIKTEEERTQQFKRKWKKDVFHFPYAFPFKNVPEWESWVNSNGVKNKEGVFDQAAIELACHYIKAYGFQIDFDNNVRIKDFDDIVALAQKRNWNLVFNLLAENTEKAGELVGKDLLFLMQENTKKLVEYYTKKGVTVVNNLDIVANDQFIDQDWTTEHYAEKGRKTIARNVAKSLKKWYNNEYIDVNDAYKTTFFNDFERLNPWNQMHTLTDQQAYSGTHSSKTGNGEDFSVSFEYPINLIPDSLRKTVTIDAWMYQENSNHNAQFNVEVYGVDEKFINSYPIKSQLNKITAWQQFHLTIPLPKTIKNPNFIKLYLYNTSETTIYLDNFSVKFE
ncbi:MAG: DUF4843 domain-containing protein [Crocinitomicaceae bacterium]|nr:DUF4843 domain-containing protein [Crocinitomicaceae bacterium]